MIRQTPTRLCLAAVLVLMTGVFLTCTDKPPTQPPVFRANTAGAEAVLYPRSGSGFSASVVPGASASSSNGLEVIVTDVGLKLTFEGGVDLNPIPTTAGVSFLGWLTIIDADDGGSGNFANEPSPSTIAFWLTGQLLDTEREIIFDEPVSAVSFFYTSAVPVTVTGFNTEGDPVADASGPANAPSMGPGGDTGGTFDLFSPLGIDVGENVITHVVMTGLENQTGIDDLVIERKGSIKVNVIDSGESGVSGLVVTVVNTQLGPFRPDGSLTIGVTDGGMASFDRLELGGYGAHVRDLVSVDNATVSNSLVAPGDETPDQGGNFAPAILLSSPNPGTVSEILVSSDQYFDMLDNPPIVLSPEYPHAEVTILVESLEGAQLQLLDPNGDCAGDVWTMIVELRRANGDPPPWSEARGLTGSDVPAILVATAPTDADCNVDVNGLPNAPVVIQSEFSADGSAVTVELSEEDRGPLGTVVATPLACVTDMFDEQAGDGRPRHIDFEKTFFGTKGRFDEGANKVPIDQAFVYYDQTGNGFGVLRVKGKVGSKRINRFLTYFCHNGDCKFKFGDFKPHILEGVQFAAQGDSKVRVTWMLKTSVEGTPVENLRFRLVAFGDVVPDYDSGSRWIPIEPAEQCSADIAGDPRFWIGH